jgi:hypothetical protein
LPDYVISSSDISCGAWPIAGLRRAFKQATARLAGAGCGQDEQTLSAGVAEGFIREDALCHETIAREGKIT